MGDKISDYKKTFNLFHENLKNFLSQVNIPEAENSTNADFNADAYWENNINIAKKLGFEANKVTIMWINSPVPANKDMVAVCSALEIACLALLNSYHSYPVSEGRLVKSNLKNAILDILENCSSFSSVLLNSIGSKYTNDNHPLVVICGVVMKHCEVIPQLPRDNRTACAETLKAEANVIKDALREIEEARTSDGFMDEFMECDESWSEADKEILNPLLGMIKTSGALVKKCMDCVKKQTTTFEDSSVFDVIVEKFSRISPGVDDLALTVYPPLNWEDAKQQAWKLKQILEENLEYLSTVLLEEESVAWLQFIKKAVAHNAAEIQRVFILHGLAELSLT